MNISSMSITKLTEKRSISPFMRLFHAFIAIAREVINKTRTIGMNIGRVGLFTFLRYRYPIKRANPARS